MSLVFAHAWWLLIAPVSWLLIWWLERRRALPRVVLVASLSLVPEQSPRVARAAVRRSRLDLWLLWSAAMALTLCFSGPRVESVARASRRHVMVVDRGAAMNADGQRRWRRARAAGEAQLAAWPATDQLALSASPAAPGGPFVGAVGEAGAWLAALLPCARPAELEAAVTRALAQSSELTLVSDREPRLAPGLARRVRLVADALELENVGFVSAGARRLKGPEERVQLTIENASPRARRLLVEVAVSEGTGEATSRVLRRPLELEPRARGVVQVSAARSWRILRARIRGASGGELEGDALALDDVVVMTRRAEAPLPVFVSGATPPALLDALSSVPGLQLVSGDASGPGLKVISSTSLGPAAPPALLVLLPEGDGAEGFEAVRLLPSGPFAGLEPDVFEVARGRAAPPSGLRLEPLLVDAGGRVLGGWSGRGSELLVYLGFAPQAADTGWVKRRGFPLFIAALIEELGASEPGLLWAARCGAPLELRELSGRASRRWRVRSPSGAEAELEGRRRYVVDEPGLHSYQAGSTRGVFGAGLLWSEGAGLPACRRAAEPSATAGALRPARWSWDLGLACSLYAWASLALLCWRRRG